MVNRPRHLQSSVSPFWTRRRPTFGTQNPNQLLKRWLLFKSYLLRYGPLDLTHANAGIPSQPRLQASSYPFHTLQSRFLHSSRRQRPRLLRLRPGNACPPHLYPLRCGLLPSVNHLDLVRTASGDWLPMENKELPQRALPRSKRHVQRRRWRHAKILFTKSTSMKSRTCARNNAPRMFQ